MAQRRFHYEVAFERYLRDRTIPYVAVDEAKRALSDASHPPASLKSFDFVVYSRSGANLLIDVKGRKQPRVASKRGASARTLQNWVTRADVDSLVRWQTLFGPGFVGAFAFLYWCDGPPPGALFADVFESGQRWYAVQAVTLEDYRRHMRPRSARWETVHVATADFARIARPLKEML